MGTTFRADDASNASSDAAAAVFRVSQRAAVQDFWTVYEEHKPSIQAGTVEWLRKHLELRLGKCLDDARVQEEHRHSQAILARAVAGDLGFYTEQLEGAGRRYAELGVGFASACDLATGFRRQLVTLLVERFSGEPVRLTAAIEALDHFTEYSTTVIAQAYIQHRESQSRAREADLAITLDSIGDAVVVIDEEEQIDRMNPVAERLTGWSLSECRGQALARIFRIENEDTGEPLDSAVTRVLREGAVVGLSSHTVLITRDGARRPIAHSAAPVRKENGQIRGVVLVFRDVTEERKNEHELRHWERIFQHATWGISVASTPDLTFQAVNPAYAEMHGYSVRELIGAPVSMLWTPETRAQMERNARQSEQAGRLWLEATHRASDGRQFPVEIIASTIKDASGRSRWLVANVQDITERKKLQVTRLRALELEAENRRIEAANHLKSEFLANMSHELRTPLNSVIGFAELLHDEQVGDVTARQREFLGEILTGGRHLLRLINEVLELANVEAGKLDLRPEPADLRQLVAAVVQGLRATALERGLAIEVFVDPTLSDVVLDHGRFKQVLYNYLSNALKFTPNRGRVAVRVTEEGRSWFRLEVEDSGLGVSSEDAARLFTAFQQLESSAAERLAGTGLGLALTKGIAEAQGGSVGMRPAPQQGSIFFAVLPRSAAAPRAESARTESARVPRNGVKPVVVIDADRSSRELMETTLAKLGQPALCFSNVSEALARLEQVEPRAFVLDLDMPQLLAFIERFQSAPDARGVPIMLWTVKELSPQERSVLPTSVSLVVPKGSDDDTRWVAELIGAAPALESLG